VNIDRLKICDTVQSDRCTRTFRGGPSACVIKVQAYDGCRFLRNVGTCLPD
jgi:hypothetical protein